MKKEYLGNAFMRIATALEKGWPLVLSPEMMEQILAENAALIEAKNELVRLNIALAERISIQSELLSKRAEREV